MLQLIQNVYAIKKNNLSGYEIGLMFLVLRASLSLEQTEKLSKEKIENLLDLITAIARLNINLRCSYGGMSYYVESYMLSAVYAAFEKQNFNSFYTASITSMILEAIEDLCANYTEDNMQINNLGTLLEMLLRIVLNSKEYGVNLSSHDIRDILVRVIIVYNKISEKLTNHEVEEITACLYVVLKNKSTADINEKEIKAVLDLIESVLKLKTKFVVIDIAGVSLLTDELFRLIVEKNCKNPSLKAAFDALWGTSVNVVDGVNDSEVVRYKKRLVFSTSRRLITFFSETASTIEIGDWFTYVFSKLKDVLNVGVSPQNEEIVYGFMYYVIDLLDYRWDKKASEIVQTAVKKEFPKILELVIKVLSSNHKLNTCTVKESLKSLLKLSQMGEEWSEQVKSKIKGLGLAIESDKIVLRDDSMLNKLPNAKKIEKIVSGIPENEIEEDEDKEDNNAENQEHVGDVQGKEDKGNKLDPENDMERQREKRISDIENKKVISGHRKEKNKDMKLDDNINPKGKNEEHNENKNQKDNKVSEIAQENKIYEIVSGTKNHELKKSIELGNIDINNPQSTANPNMQSNETDNKTEIQYNNSQILEEIERAYCQNREINSSISKKELLAAIKSNKRYYYYAAMLSSKKYNRIKKCLSFWEWIVTFVYCLIFFKSYDPKKNNAYKQPGLNKDKNEIVPLHRDTIEQFQIYFTTQGKTNNQNRNNCLK